MIKYVFLKYHSDCNVCVIHIHIFTWVNALKSTKASDFWEWAQLFLPHASEGDNNHCHWKPKK